MPQEISRLKGTVIVNIGHRGHLKLLLEKTAEVLWIHIQGRSQVLQIDFSVVMFLNIAENLLVLIFSCL